MFRIRFHGRGGQGMKTASRILGTAFFMAGYEVQDAPRYGAERRGAPIFAYVRAAKAAINERGIIYSPDLVIVADDTLVGMPAAGVTQGIDAHTVLLINSHESAASWQKRLHSDAKILILAAQEEVEDRAALPHIGSRCAAAAAALTNVISRKILIAALSEELAHLDEDIIKHNRDIARGVFDDISGHAGLLEQGDPPSATDYVKPGWIDMPFENAQISNLAIHSGVTSVMVRTGLWRTMRPVINYDKCSGCVWICSTYCPDGAIDVRADVRMPAIVNLDGFYLSFTREPVDLPNASKAQAFVGEYDPENLQFRGNTPLSQAMAVLGSGPYSYFRYEAHLAVQQALSVYEEITDEFADIFGRRYDMIDCYRMDDAEYVFVMMGSFSTKARDAVDSLRAAGCKAGLLRPRLFRPFPHLRIRQLLQGRRAVGVIDQNISMGMGGVLHSEFATALYGIKDAPLLGSYIGGLGGRDISQQEFFAIVDELKQAYDSGESLPPRLLYTENELTEMRKLQAIAQAEHAEIHQS